MLKKYIVASILLFLAAFCYGQTNFSKGEDLLMQNSPSQAVVFLERALAEDPANTIIYLYLGIVYEQLNRADEAIALYRRALPIAGSMSANVATNLGNVYFMKGNHELAEQFYTQAINHNSVYSSAFLGRGNTRVRSGQLTNAVVDYERYLILEPGSSQRDSIQQMIVLIRAETAAEEMKRVIAEEEKRRLEEERQRLLDSVSASLQSLGDSSKGISSGAESVENYEGEFELD